MRSVTATRRWALVTVALTVVLGSLAGCGGGDKSGGSGSAGSAPYKITIIGSLTGAIAALSGPNVSAVKMAFDAANDAGGVNGHKIEYTVIDDQSTTTGAQAAGQQAVSGSPVAIVDASGIGFVAREPIYKVARMPVVTHAVDEALMVPTPPAWAFTVGQTNSQLNTYMTKAMQTALATSLEGKKIALMSVADVASAASASAALTKAFEDLGAEVFQEKIPIGTASMASQAANMVGEKPDGVASLLSGPDTAMAAQALITAGYAGKIVANGAASDTALFEKVNSDQLTGVRQYPYPVEGTKLYGLVQKYGQGAAAKGNAGYFTLGYAASQLLLATLAKCEGRCAPEQFEKAAESLGNFSIDNAFGDLTIKSDRHVAPNFAQLYGWDQASKAPKPIGDPLPLGDPEAVATS